MKKNFLVGLAAGLLMLCMIGTASASLIQNGTFDTDFSGWTLDGNNRVVDSVAQVGAPGADADSSITQKFTIDSSTSSVNIGFDYLWVGNLETNVADVFTATFSYYHLDDSLTEIVLVDEKNHDGFLTSTFFDEQYFLSNLSQSDENAWIEFALVESLSTETQGTRINLDNVVISSVPEPSTMLLLGTGLAGLALYGRKRKKA